MQGVVGVGARGRGSGIDGGYRGAELRDRDQVTPVSCHYDEL